MTDPKKAMSAEYVAKLIIATEDLDYSEVLEWITQASQEAYERGKRDGYAEEAVGCDKDCREAYERGKKERAGFGCLVINGVLGHTQECEVHSLEIMKSGYNHAIEDAAKICERNTTPSKELCNSDYHDVRWCLDCNRMTAMADVLEQKIRALKDNNG